VDAGEIFVGPLDHFAMTFSQNESCELRVVAKGETQHVDVAGGTAKEEPY